MKTNILITSAGTGNAYATAFAIKTFFKDELFLICADINPRHLVSSGTLCDAYEQVPLLSHSNYKQTILDIIQKYNITVCLPFIDFDIQEMCKWQERGELSSTLFLQVKETAVAEICGNKFKTFQWLTEQNIHTPHTFLLDPPLHFEEAILKPIAGFGSQIKIVKPQDIEGMSQKENFILQEKCTSPEITIDVFYAKQKNEFYYLCRERIETKSGVCTKARAFTDDSLKKLAMLLAEKLNLFAFCFQVMNLNGAWAVTDINPRLGAGSSMGNEIGMNFFTAMIAEIIGRDYSSFIKQYTGECYITRQYQNIVSKA